MVSQAGRLRAKGVRSLGHLLRPHSAAAQTPPMQINGQPDDMVNQAQIRARQM